MFTIPKSPQELFKLTADYFAAFPKTQDDVKEVLEKIKTVFETESKNANEMWAIYAKASKGDASVNEISLANKKAQELLISTRFATILAFPGSVFFLPLLVKYAKDIFEKYNKHKYFRHFEILYYRCCNERANIYIDREKKKQMTILLHT